MLGTVILILLLLVGGDPNQLRPGHYAIAGVTILPTMLSVLVLIVMESDAVHKARIGELPGWVIEKFPPPLGEEK